LNARFVDSNVFVYVLMDDPVNGAKSVRILTRFEEGEETGWTSTLALGQVFSHLKKRKKPEAVDKFYEYLKESPISITETTREDVEHTKQIKEEQNLEWRMWDDLVIASQMETLKLSEIYSNDRDFKFKKLNRIF